MKKLFFLDHKSIDDLNWSIPGNSVLQILERYKLGIGDYEQNELTEAIFNRLGWGNKYKDTIFSFRTIFCKIIEIYSKENEIKLDDCKRIIFFLRNNILEFEINGYRKEKYRYNKETLYQKVINDSTALNSIMNLISKDKEIYSELEIVAKLVDSLSNFTPHPGFSFNQVKGNLENVADSLNLMIDKVQECIDNNKDLLYRQDFKIDITVLLKWKEWLVVSRILCKFFSSPLNKTSCCFNFY